MKQKRPMARRRGWVDPSLKASDEPIADPESRSIDNDELDNASKGCRHNSTIAAIWPLERQRIILQMHRAGIDALKITEIIRAATQDERIFAQQIVSLIDRGIPHPKEAEIHKCKTCHRRIVTDFCIACEIKKNQIEERNRNARDSAA